MRLESKNKKLSGEFIVQLAKWAAGFVDPNIFEKFISIIEAVTADYYFTRSAESNLLRILTSSFDKSLLINDTVKYPHYAEILVLISVNSNYLTDILVRHPEYFFFVINPSSLKIELSEEFYTSSIKNVTAAYRTFNSKINSLRNFKQKEMLRIGLKDLTGTAGLKEITEELSFLASAISSELFFLCYKEVLDKYKIENIKRQYCLVALGKLGGRELNYSSDIDLILFFDKNTKIKDKEYFEIVVEAAYLFIEQATAITGSGYLYRVDFRLRPDGRNSPLARTLSNYLAYYESRGEDWERQMLIKASFVAGSKKLFYKFSDYLSPFIYPASVSTSPVEQIKKMKINIERKLKSDDNIKLVPGGIRDIEFSIQALQLLNGGKNKLLRSGNSLTTIEKLFEAKLLSGEETIIFESAYILFRRIEHYLQLMSDAQTHTIPSDGELLEKLSSSLGYKSSEQFKNDLAYHRDQVHSIFSSIMNIQIGSGEITNLIDSINFSDKLKAARNLDFLREGKGIFGQKTFDTQTSNAFLSIEPEIEKYLSKSINPDLVLQHFVRVIRPVGMPSVFYTQLNDNFLLNTFLDICENSQKAIDLFAENDELRDFFITKKVFEKLSLRYVAPFKINKLLFILSVQFAAGLINSEFISAYLKKYIYKHITDCLINFSEQHKLPFNFFVAALGSLGAGEMSFNSDVDLIFVADKLVQGEGFEKHFNKLLADIHENLKPLDVDCRLRPEGKSSQLLWDLEEYKKYFENRARIWELQAFTKLSFISGDEKSFVSFTKIIKNRIKKEKCPVIKNEMAEMRKKMEPQVTVSFSDSFSIKKSRGGLADVEFLIQYFILCNPALYNKCRGKNIIKSINLVNDKFTGRGESAGLIETFRFFRNLNFLNQNIFNSQSASIPKNEEKLKMLAFKSGFSNTAELLNKIKSSAELNKKLFDKYITQVPRG